ncbi:TPA: HAD-IC family P-type ATPase [Clostridioides difficile]|uniref:HAD-IC family P-type ATPase n=1 Tax=Clostridioides difficile TaxID=1496 RepID=UPI001034809B|nr:HAD-IC family P-type ATPase [Clostridioides difficile]MCI4889331.1 HAD-IC family P-type ATPase [Clostridioides difficile]HBF0235533.1 HAD-IC family P-type ATPase [Clostridioides difficile]HBF3709928.1 HAD-IC family P-type ATPase [Clostridioides difficile]HBK3172858.1 HAD-IC family P-type ATPase [Clostridioides difficile]HEL5644716.1 HAD-IC family P-type ATPase [Clostridioides difficile]
MDKVNLERYSCDINVGLNKNQLQSRIDDNLINAFDNGKTKTYKQIFKDNIFTLFNLINIVLVCLLVSVGSFKNTLFIFIAVINTIIGVIQEIRAKRLLDNLSVIVSNKVSVIREKEKKEIDVQELVLDDIMILKTGNQICADSKVLNGKLEVNESLVTGESDIIIKNKGDFLYSGSFVVSGEAFVRVENIGKDNYANKIANDAKISKKHNSQLRNSLNAILKIVGIIIIPLGIILFAKQHFGNGDSIATSVVGTVAAVNGMIPEGLTLLTSIALAVGTIKLASHKTLVQELYCVETLARVDTLCLDKTGTITEGKMQVDDIVMLEEVDINEIMGNICNSLKDDNATLNAIRDKYNVLDTYKAKNLIPFSSERKYSGVTFENKGTYLLGAFEFIFKEKNKKLRIEVERYSKKGNRVIVLAHSDSYMEDNNIPEDIKPLAFILILDKIRDEAKETLEFFYNEGVDIKIISGDNPITVSEVARKAGLKTASNFIDATTLKNDSDIYKAVDKYSVFGRVSPQQKKQMILALKKQNHTVAMTGDGVNDVLALKEADCSIAMSSGSDVTKNVSNLVLLDSNFASMPKVVMEGRKVINNIQRASSLFLVKTIFSFFLSLLTLFFFSRQYPFVPIQLSLIGAVTVGIPSFFLALEANKSRISGNFLLNILKNALPGALCVTVNVIIVYNIVEYLGYSSSVFSTMCAILTGVCGLLILRQQCLPFNKERLFLIVSMTIAFVIGILFLGGLFSFVALSRELILITMALAILMPIMIKVMLFVLDEILETIVPDLN